MKLTREKVIQLSHRIMAAVADLDEVEIFEEMNTIRQEVVKVMNDLLVEEEKIEAGVRQKIVSQKRTIPEGGAEWEILFRKYYQEELRKMGIAPASPART